MTPTTRVPNMHPDPGVLLPRRDHRRVSFEVQVGSQFPDGVEPPARPVAEVERLDPEGAARERSKERQGLPVGAELRVAPPSARHRKRGARERRGPQRDEQLRRLPVADARYALTLCSPSGGSNLIVPITLAGTATTATSALASTSSVRTLISRCHQRTDRTGEDR